MEPAWNTANVWLTVLAVASVAQVTCLIVAMLYAARMFRRLSETVNALERRSEPILTRASVCVDDVRRLVARLEQTEAFARGAIQRASATADRVGAVVSRAKDIARWRMWPILGLVQGAGAALSTLAGSRRRPSRRDLLDETAEARFGYEGGANALDVR